LGQKQTSAHVRASPGAVSAKRSAYGWTISEIILWGQRPLIEQLDKLSYWDCKAALYPAVIAS
jgi:hypothetical protein